MQEFIIKTVYNEKAAFAAFLERKYEMKGRESLPLIIIIFMKLK